jgi:chromosome partitioning protein
VRTLAVLNQKGGVGKTTTVANVAAGLARSGQRVLAIDLDPQAHLTIHLGTDPRQIKLGSYQVLTASAPIAEAAVQVRENLWLVGASVDLVGAESELVSVVGREIILREALESVAERFDYMLIDCPPSLGLLTLNALTAVREVIIPLQPHFLALQGLGKLLETVTIVRRRINPKLIVSGILLCMYDRRVTLSTEVRTDIEKFIAAAHGTDCAWSQAQVIPTAIRPNVKLAEAPSYGKTIFEYDEACNGSIDYRAVAEFVHLSLGKPVVIPPVSTVQPQAPAAESTAAAAPLPQVETPVASQVVETSVAPQVIEAPVAVQVATPIAPQPQVVQPQPAAPETIAAVAVCEPAVCASTETSLPQPPSEPAPARPDEHSQIAMAKE